MVNQRGVEGESAVRDEDFNVERKGGWIGRLGGLRPGCVPVVEESVDFGLETGNVSEGTYSNDWEKYTLQQVLNRRLFLRVCWNMFS
jgi:hypothetical protein